MTTRSSHKRRAAFASGAAVIALAVALALGGCASSSAPAVTTTATSTAGVTSGDSVFDISGTWTGHRERIAATEGYRDGTATLTVTATQGLTFTGTMTWSTPDGDVTQSLAGAMTPGGALVAGSDEEGDYAFSVVDPDTLDYCYTEHGADYRTTCARLVRQG